MSKVPGLTPVQDDVQTQGRPSSGRVVVNERGIQTQALRPAAAPVDLYARPARADADSTLEDLAGALSALNPALERYAQVRQRTDEEMMPARIAERYAGRSVEEMKVLMKDDPDMQKVAGKKLIAGHSGRAFAEQQARRAAELYATEFDKDSGDIDTFLNDIHRQAIEANKDNPFFAQEFSGVFGPVAQSIRNQQVEYRSKRSQEKVQETIHGSFLGTVRQGILQEDDPAAIADALRGSYDANRDLLKVSYPDQDKAMVGVIQQLTLQMDEEPGNAEKLFGVIKALASNPRTASDGTKLGRLLDSGELGPDVAKLMSAAEQKLSVLREMQTVETIDGFDIQAENGTLDTEALDTFFNDPKNKGVMTPARRSSLMARDRASKEQAAAALIKGAEKERVRAERAGITSDGLAAADQGRLGWLGEADYMDESGEVKTITVERRRTEVARAIIAREQRRVEADTRAPEVVASEAFNRQVQIFSENNLEHPQWSQVLSAGVAAMTTIQAGTPLPEATRTGYDLYKQLHAKVPNYLRNQLSSDEANVYEAARILEQAGLAGAEEALATTQRFYSDPTRSSAVVPGLKDQDILTQIKGYRGSTIWDAGYIGHFDNPEVMFGEVSALTKVLVGAGGLKPKTAIEKATEHVARGYQVVNGWAVKTNDRNVPADFGKLATRFLKEWHGKNGEETGLDLDDITIRELPNTSAGWAVVVKGTGLPALVGVGGVLTMRELASMEEQDRQAAIEKAAQENADRYKPMLSVPGLGIAISRPRWLEPYTDEEWEKIKEENAKVLSAPPKPRAPGVGSGRMGFVPARSN